VKFKYIFIILNLTLFVFISILALMPLFLAGTPGLTSWQTNLPFVLFLKLILIAFNAFYFINRRLFFLLEKEDWPALVRYLEDRIIQKGRYSPRLVRLLANSYLVLSDSAAVMSFENKVAIAKPALVDANVLLFGAARILGKDISGAIRFFEVRKNTAKSETRDWVRWYYGFSLLLSRQTEKAAAEFSLLAQLSKDAVITALSSYFLEDTLSRALPEHGPELQSISKRGSERVLKALPRQKDWEREVSRLSAEIHAAILSKYMKETGRWLYASLKQGGG
jgi:hypothetical protein